MLSDVCNVRMLPAAAHVSGDTCAASITQAVPSAATGTLVERTLLARTSGALFTVVAEED